MDESPFPQRGVCCTHVNMTTPARNVLESTVAAGLLMVDGGWTFAPFCRESNAAMGGFDCVATTWIAKGTVLLSEAPLLEAIAPEKNVNCGWAADILETFCKATDATREALLATTAAGSPGGDKEITTASDKMLADADAEVELFMRQTAFKRHAGDKLRRGDLVRIAMIFNLNSYGFGEGRGALFQLGCMFNRASYYE